MSPAMKTALILLAITVGLIAIGWMCNHYIREIVMRFESPPEPQEPVDPWPKRNVGGSYEWQDGSITPYPWGDEWSETKCSEWYARTHGG